jgi:hypothetical protein
LAVRSEHTGVVQPYRFSRMRMSMTMRRIIL